MAKDSRSPKSRLAGRRAGGSPTPVPAALAPASRAPGASRFARQADQSPRASLDRPWDNLHPERVWPD
jgi:hypothetical protein